MPLTADEATRLATLQAQYDKIISGQNPTLIAEGQSRTQFGAGDTDKLKQEIEALQAKAALDGSERGAIRFSVGNRRGCW